MQSYAAVDVGGRRGVVLLANSANGHAIMRAVAARALGRDAPGYVWQATYGAYTEPARALLSRVVRAGAGGVTAADATLPRSDLRWAAERLAKAGRADAAVALLRPVVATPAADARDRVLLADALRRVGGRAEARAVAEVALRLAPGDAEAERVLARIAQDERVVPPERLARYAGRYSSPFGPLEIRSDGRRLSAHLPDQPPSPMPPLSDGAFLMEATGVPIEFVEGAGGVVTHAVVRAGGEIRLPRIGAER